MVLVSHPHKFIFLKTRKTAGTSVEMLLEPFCRPAGDEITEKTTGSRTDSGLVGFRLLGPNNTNITALRSHATANRVFQEVDHNQWHTYFRFSCLRNPFDKALSQFFWDHDAKGKPPFVSFNEATDAFHSYILNEKLKSDRSIVHRKGKFILNGFLRYEALTDDLTQLREHLNLSFDIQNLTHAKSKTSRMRDVPISAFYTDEIADSVRRQLSWIFEHGKYSTGPKDADEKKIPPPSNMQKKAIV